MCMCMWAFYNNIKLRYFRFRHNNGQTRAHTHTQNTKHLWFRPTDLFVFNVVLCAPFIISITYTIKCMWQFIWTAYGILFFDCNHVPIYRIQINWMIFKFMYNAYLIYEYGAVHLSGKTINYTSTTMFNANLSEISTLIRYSSNYAEWWCRRHSHFAILYSSQNIIQSLQQIRHRFAVKRTKLIKAKNLMCTVFTKV